MANDDELQLTPRQRQVLELIDRRMTHKQIAVELGISPARVSQYVRTLKDRMGVETLAQIVERYRVADLLLPSNEIPSQSIKVPAGPNPGHQIGGEDSGSLVFADVERGPAIEAWPVPAGRECDELKIVPGVLDGKHAALWRIGVMLSVAFGVIVLLIGGLTAADTISDFLEQGEA